MNKAHKYIYYPLHVFPLLDRKGGQWCSIHTHMYILGHLHTITTPFTLSHHSISGSVLLPQNGFPPRKQHLASGHRVCVVRFHANQIRCPISYRRSFWFASSEWGKALMNPLRIGSRCDLISLHVSSVLRDGVRYREKHSIILLPSSSHFIYHKLKMSNSVIFETIYYVLRNIAYFRVFMHMWNYMGIGRRLYRYLAITGPVLRGGGGEAWFTVLCSKLGRYSNMRWLM